jgi:hypothetical protein
LWCATSSLCYSRLHYSTSCVYHSVVLSTTLLGLSLPSSCSVSWLTWQLCVCMVTGSSLASRLQPHFGGAFLCTANLKSVPLLVPDVEKHRIKTIHLVERFWFGCMCVRVGGTLRSLFGVVIHLSHHTHTYSYRPLPITMLQNTLTITAINQSIKYK